MNKNIRNMFSKVYSYREKYPSSGFQQHFLGNSYQDIDQGRGNGSVGTSKGKLKIKFSSYLVLSTGRKLIGRRAVEKNSINYGTYGYSRLGR